MLNSRGFGYDIEYINAGGRRRYVEVKSTTNGKEAGIRFYMSESEFEFGIYHADDYLVYYVCNTKSAHPQTLIFENEFINHGFNKENFSVDV